MFSNVTSNFKTGPILTKYITHIISKNTCVTNRFLSGKPNIEQNLPKTTLQQNILRDRNCALPYLYLIQSPGKLVSTKLIHGFNKWLEVPEEKVHEITDISQTLHHSTLILDDILDKAILRRDIPAANTIFTTANTLNAGNFIYFQVVLAACQLGHPEAAYVVVKNLMDCHRGQAIELSWTEKEYIPTLEEYEECVCHKTAAAYWLPIKVLELFSKKKYNFVPLMNAFSRYFQIRDDYNDLFGIDHTTPSDDITTGRYTYLTIHALRNNPDDYQIKRILQLETQDYNIKKHLISLLERYGTLEHTRVLLQNLEKDFRKEIQKLGGSPKLEEVTEYLSSSGNYNN